MSDSEEPESVMWLSVDPRTNAVIPYDAVVAQILERAYSQKKPECKLVLGGMPFLVKFGIMQQVNSSGGARKVIRRSNLPERLNVKVIPLDPVVCAQAMSLVDQVDAAVASLEKNETVRKFVIENPVEDPAPLVAVFDSILSVLAQPRYCAKYGFSSDSDAELLRIPFGDSVPAYFANVNSGQSIFNRKVLSLLGLRNLAKYGFDIFNEMKAKMFSGRIADYADRTGPHKMKYFTGNVVDLDSCVLRCHEAATLATVNAMRAKEGEAPFKGAKDLAESEFGRRLAVTQAQMVIDDFVRRFKLTPAEIKKRNLELDPEDLNLPVATTNDDRGKCAAWIYINLGVLTFHANVPSMGDVYGALLRAPYHMAKAFVMINQQSKTPEELEAALDEFFEEAVSDSCFNAKWKSIESFVEAREQLGSIDNVLNRLMQSNQKAFMAIEDDEDGTKECELMLKLAVGVVAFDRDKKQRRAIVAQDVQAWHKKVMSAA